MNAHTEVFSTRKTSFVALAAVATVALVMSISSPASAVEATVPLGLTSNFAVLAGAGITNTGETQVSGTAGGDMGSSPTTSFTGEELVTTNGTKYLAGEAIVADAKDDLVTAYDNAAGRTTTMAISDDLGGKILFGGVYTSATPLGLTGTLTLDAQNDSSTVFIFQAGSTLTTASTSAIELINGAQASNVFWQVGSSATFGANSSFVGHVLALTSISANQGATFAGQLLARNGAVTLINNTITNDLYKEVAVVKPDPTPEPTPDPTPEPTPPVTQGPVEDSTVDGGVLPDTGSAAWIGALAVGVTALVLGVTAYKRRRKRL